MFQPSGREWAVFPNCTGVFLFFFFLSLLLLLLLRNFSICKAYWQVCVDLIFSEYTSEVMSLYLTSAGVWLYANRQGLVDLFIMDTSSTCLIDLHFLLLQVNIRMSFQENWLLGGQSRVEIYSSPIHCL